MKSGARGIGSAGSRIAVGDVVNVAGCHKHYRPVVREIVGDVAHVSSLPSWPTREVKLADLSPAVPIERGNAKNKRSRR